MFSLNLSEKLRILHPFLSFFRRKIPGLRFITKKLSKSETAFLQDTLPRGMEVQTEPDGTRRTPAAGACAAGILFRFFNTLLSQTLRRL